MRHLIFALCLAAAGCAGQEIPVQGAAEQPPSDNSALGVVAQGVCLAGIVAIGVVTLNPGAVDGASLCN